MGNKETLFSGQLKGIREKADQKKGGLVPVFSFLSTVVAVAAAGNKCPRFKMLPQSFSVLPVL
jgi:hypothetical protein